MSDWTCFLPRAAVLAALAACGHSGPPGAPAPATTTSAAPAPTPAFDPSAPLRLEPLGSPIASVRTWATALAPNSHGGWNFITQSFELFSNTPTEFVVVDLSTGQTTLTEGTPGIYTGARYTYQNELRAPNGRIFFPESTASLAYYDPDDETVKELGNLIDPPGPTKSFYKGMFASDGMLYLGTQSDALPMIVQLDPVTLKSKIIGEVGNARIGYSFARDFVVDPPWIYVAVGENPWELAALDMRTGKSKILATRNDNGWMKLEVKPEGVVATLITGLRTPAQKQEQVWCVDGKTVPFDPSYDPAQLPFKPHHIVNARAVPEHPPELDVTKLNPDGNGVGHIRWRATGSSAWNDVAFPVKYTFPITIESLTSAPNGGVLGNGAQYHGFFRYAPGQGLVAFGAHGPSEPVYATYNGIVYITGYPNGVLYAYDPSKPWHSTGKDQDDRKDPQANPQVLGVFAESHTKYAVDLQASSRGRLFYAGRRERDGVGGGVGSYDIATRSFAGGAHDLELLNPSGLAVLDDRVVYSGHLPSARPGTPNEAPLVIYDLDLNEKERIPVKAGLRDTGRLFTTGERNVILGVVTNEQVVYRYDVAKHALLASQPLPAPPRSAAQNPADHSVWAIMDRQLVRIDAATLAVTPIGAADLVPDKAGNLVWEDGELYLSAGGELYRVTNAPR